MKKEMVSVIGITISFLLLLIAIFLPWYSSSLSVEGSQFTSDIYLDKSVMNSPITGEIVQEHSDGEGVDYIFNTMYIMILTLLIAIISCTIIFVYYFKHLDISKLKVLIIVTGVGTLIFSILTVYYFMAGVLDTIKTSKTAYIAISGQDLGDLDIGFWWSTTINGAEISAGPGWAWYLVIFAGIIALVSSLLFVTNQKSKN